MYMHDIIGAAEAIRRIIGGRSKDEFASDEDARASVERRFEIIGEALRQATDAQPMLESRISEARKIINFRNLLIHGYHLVDPFIVWDIARTKLPKLLEEARAILGE
jgi:uncharacterized protein with HEPN domain